MADLESKKETVNLVAMQAARVVMMTFSNTEAGHQPAKMPNQQENPRLRNRG